MLQSRTCSATVDAMTTKEPDAGKCAAVTLSGLGLAALPRIACAPWWAVLLLSAAGFIVICLSILVPDESADKLTMLRGLRNAWNAWNDRKRRDR